MATLTEAAYYARRTINWAILALILYGIFRILWGIAVVSWLYFFPPKPQPPNFLFGRLPAIGFPHASPSAQLTFTLDTIEGGIPAASESASVFFMPKPQASLLAIPKTQEFAKRLGFETTPIEETKTMYRFLDASTSLRRLRYDIVSNNFILRYEFDKDPQLFLQRNIPTPGAAIAEAKSMLQTLNLFVPDLADSTIKATFLKHADNAFTQTTSMSRADAVRVDFFRRHVAKTPVFTPYPNEGQVTFIFSGSKDADKRILELRYAFWSIDYETNATYALKSGTAAWEELKQGKGYIARLPSNGKTNAVVRNVFLGYYDSFDPQTYLQPIFVFEGDYDFLAYVPAVTQEWIR